LSISPNIGLPYIDVGQAQKEVTHNEALAALDVLVQGAVINATTTAPPGSPTDGQAWIVAASATGAWAGKDKQIAAWFGGWRFYPPKEGWRVWDQAADVIRTFDGTNWRVAPAVQTPTLGGSWIAYGGGYGGPRYYKAPDGKVTIEGMMQSGADGTIFTLLAGFRPADRLVFVCWSGGGAYRVDVTAAGDVIVTGSNSVFSSLSGISFYAA
jgi:hypothetical protein